MANKIIEQCYIYIVLIEKIPNFFLNIGMYTGYADVKPIMVSSKGLGQYESRGKNKRK